MGGSVDISQFSIYILRSYPKGVFSPPIKCKKEANGSGGGGSNSSGT